MESHSYALNFWYERFVCDFNRFENNVQWQSCLHVVAHVNKEILKSQV